MAKKPTVQQCHALTAYYTEKFQARYGRKPNISIWSARWGWEAVLMGMNFQEAKDLIDYYFTTSGDRMHDLDWFFYNYHKLEKASADSKHDKSITERLMEESRERAEAWRKSGKRTIAGSQRSSEPE